MCYIGIHIYSFMYVWYIYIYIYTVYICSFPGSSVFDSFYNLTPLNSQHFWFLFYLPLTVYSNAFSFSVVPCVLNCELCHCFFHFLKPLWLYLNVAFRHRINVTFLIIGDKLLTEFVVLRTGWDGKGVASTPCSRHFKLSGQCNNGVCLNNNNNVLLYFLLHRELSCLFSSKIISFYHYYLSLKYTPQYTEILSITTATIRVFKNIVRMLLVWIFMYFFVMLRVSLIIPVILTNNSTLSGPNGTTVSIAWGKLRPAGKLTVVLARDLASLC